MNRPTARYRWLIWACVAIVLVGVGVWLIHSGHPTARYVLRLYRNKVFMREMLNQWGVLAPLVFIVIQALQVVIAPIPGEVTGLLGGFVFGQWLGFVYSTVGLTSGSLLAFWVGRQIGAPLVRRLVNPETWARMGFIVEAEGAVLCFIIYLIPGLPKDIVCYLFGLSPMPFSIFAVVSTLGRMPGTWFLSAQGAKVAAGQYIQLALLSAIVAAVAIPLYYYRDRIMMKVSSRASGIQNGD